MRLFLFLSALTLVGCYKTTPLPVDQIDYTGTWRMAYTLDQKPGLGSQEHFSTLTLTKSATGFSGQEVQDGFPLKCDATLIINGKTGNYQCRNSVVNYQVTIQLDSQNRFTGRYGGISTGGSVVFVRQ